MSHTSGSAILVTDTLGVWTDGAVLVNPTVSTVLVSVSITTTGVYLIDARGSGSVAWVYDLQRVTAASAVAITQRFRPAAGNEAQVLGNVVSLQAGDTVRCILAEAGVTGTIQMSLLTQELPSCL